MHAGEEFPMTIIDFATAAPQPPRPFPNALVKDAARLVLADAPRGDTPVLDQNRLLLAASQLPPHAMFLIEIVANPADGRLARLEFALASPNDDRAAEVKRAARLIAPQARFKSAPSAEDDTLVWSALAPAPQILDAGVDADGAPRSIWLSPSDAAAADFQCALQCAEAAGVTRLRIVARARALRVDELAAVNHYVFSHYCADNPAALERKIVLSRWADSQQGAALSVEVAARTTIDDSALDYIALALFGRSRHAGAPRSASGLVVDLRCAVTPAAVPVFRFVPTPAELRQRWRVENEETPDHPGAITLGLDAAGDPVRLSSTDRTMHTYVIGATGVGKTTLLKNMMRGDFRGGEGVVLIDPHGDLCDWAREEATRAGRVDVTWVDPVDPACPVRLDLMNTPGVDPEAERGFVVNQLISLLSKDMYAGVPEAFGPMFEKYFRNACYLLMLAAKPEHRNLLLIQKIFADEDFREQLLRDCPDEHVREFFGLAGRIQGRDHSIEEIAPWIISKFTAFSDNSTMRRFFDPISGSKLSVRNAMDKGGIVLLRLPKAFLGERDLHLLGGLILLQIQTGLLARSAIPEERRRHVRIYVDEFQDIAGRSAAEMLSEVRRQRGSLILANQRLSQLAGGPQSADVARAVLANCGTLLAFRVGIEDAAVLAPYFAPHVAAAELIESARGDFVARRIANGSPQPAQRLSGEPPPTR